MAPPLYFFARKQMADVVENDHFRPELLEACGLADVFSDVKSVREQSATNELAKQGPGGASGVITTLSPAGGRDVLRIGYHPDFQTWRQAGPEMYVGVDDEHPPTSEDLLRSTAVRLADGRMRPPHSGWEFELAAGGRWQVPVIRRPPIAAEFGHPLSGLPMDLGWNLSGDFQETVKAEYQQLWDDCGAICDFFYAPEGLRDGEFELGVELALKWALRILSLNYRYGRHEQNVLHAIDGTNVFPLLGMAIDAPLVNRLLAKKKGGASIDAPPSSSPGSTDGPTGTDPAAASSS